MRIYLAGPDVFRPDALNWAETARSQTEKIAAIEGCATARPDGRPIDRCGLLVEDFQLPLNLMLGLACHVVQGGLLEAVMHLDRGPL